VDNVQLSEDIKKLNKIIFEGKERACAEHQVMWEQTWQQIGDRADTNKAELAIRIEDGLKDKSVLTLKQKELRDLKTNKE
jgi:hypothetical protein